MPTLKQLAEKRAPIGAEIKRMADTLGESKPDFTAEEKVQWERANADFNALTRQMDIARRSEEVGGLLGATDDRPKPGAEDTNPKRKSKKGRAADAEAVQHREETRALAIQAWFRKQSGLPLTSEQVRACKVGGLDPRKRSLDFSLARCNLQPGAMARALSHTTTTAGAYTIPQGFVYNLERAMLAFNGMRQIASVMRTDSGNSMPWPTTNDTGNAATLVSENTAVGEVDPVFAQTLFGAWKFTTGMVQIPAELMEDTAFNLSDEVSSMFGERLGRGQEGYFTTGTGTSQPQGCVTGATLGVTAASATAIAPDEIISLIHSVDPAYRKDPTFRIMFHDLVFAAIRKLKDSQNRYLFEEGQNGAPDKLKGVPILINQNMASAITTGQKTMMCGAFGKFKIRDVNQVRILRLVERFADADQIGFVGFMRSDSRLLDAGTHPVKYYAQA